MFKCICIVAIAALCLAPAAAWAATDVSEYFAIHVVDEETGRGVPMVELTTTNSITLVTDSNGIAAFREPGLMDGQQVYFCVKSHGYEYPCDGFGYCGAKLHPRAGEMVELKIKRINVAERLYRMTGAGIYRDSILTGYPVPLAEPLLNGKVMGQDSAIAGVYRDKLYWFWGDTSVPAYALGNFASSGATSELPGNGGLNPDEGVNLTYFVNEAGFSKGMCKLAGPGLVWLGGLMTIDGEDGNERLVVRFMRMEGLGKTLERGLALFNDEKGVFEPITSFDFDLPLFPRGHPSRVKSGGEDYYYFGMPHPLPLPNVRIPARLESLKDQRQYEAFSCLQQGARYEGENTRLDRDEAGRLIYAWKKDTEALGHNEVRTLVDAGKMKPAESRLQLRDIDTGEAVLVHSGSACWNAFRKRWVLIGQETLGTSFGGEVWYAEADTPVGPWVYARKIMTHDKYTFYNPKQHPYFAQNGGRTVYLEGTYTDAFSAAPAKTPRYDYNQIMYRLDLGDARLFLPVPVYEVDEGNGRVRYLLHAQVEAQNCWEKVVEIAFFAHEVDRKRDGMVSVSPSPWKKTAPLFCALPASADPQDNESVKPLYRYRGPKQGQYLLSTEAQLEMDGFKREEKSLGRVWGNPMTVVILDPGAKAADNLASANSAIE